MKRAALLVTTLGMTLRQEGDPKATEIWSPVPSLVDPGGEGLPPSDSVVLFDGKSVSEWRGAEGDA